MRQLYITLTLLCTCGLAQMNAQFTLSLDAGIGHSRFNKQPEITVPSVDFDRLINADSEKLRATRRDAVGITVGYAPAEKTLGYSLRVQYLRRGYQHVFIDNLGVTGVRFQEGFSSEIHFIDFQPGLNFNIGRKLKISGGPYASISVGQTRNPFQIEGEYTLQRSDYGGHLGTSFHLGRLFFRAHYQHSLRDFSLASFSDFNNGSPAPESSSPISAFVVGAGYQLIR